MSAPNNPTGRSSRDRAWQGVEQAIASLGGKPAVVPHQLWVGFDKHGNDKFVTISLPRVRGYFEGRA